MFKICSVVVLSCLLAACGGGIEDNTQDVNDPLWTETAQRIEIIKGTGPFTHGLDNQEWDYSRDTLLDGMESKLISIEQVTSNLSCANDSDTTYEILVTHDSGTKRRYVSNNKDCGHLNQFRFINDIDAENLILIIEDAAISEKLALVDESLLKWQSNNFQNLTYQYDFDCWNCNDISILDLPVSLNIVNSALDSVTPDSVSSTITLADRGSKFFTIEDLFLELKDLIQNNPNEIEFEFDSTYGYPTLIEYNPVPLSTSIIDVKKHSISVLQVN